MKMQNAFSKTHMPLFDTDEVQITPADAGAPSYLRDHRARLRVRFLQGGADAIPDYEMLELIL